jgi:hypothetical protein
VDEPDVAVPAAPIAPAPEDVASEAPTVAPLPGPCGTWVERGEHLYRRTTFAFLSAEPERPGRVVVRAFLSDLWECGRCPHGAMCEPCGSRVVLRPFRGAADDAAFTVFGTAVAGRCCDAYLGLGPGYRRHGGTSVDPDPRQNGAWLEAAEPIDDSLCSAESFAAEAEASAVSEPCLADSVPGTVMARAGDVPLPTPGMLDTTEMLRRAEVSFAAGRWDEARTGYFRMEREAMRDDLAVWGYVTWRMAQCDLRLGDGLHAIERLTSALGMGSWEDAAIPWLREAALADLGRACAAAFQGAADVEAFLAEKVEGNELLAALGALAEAWESQGRAEEARAVRSAIERRRRASADGGSGP